jgi:hypothetical protein
MEKRTIDSVRRKRRAAPQSVTTWHPRASQLACQTQAEYANIGPRGLQSRFGFDILAAPFRSVLDARAGGW